MLRRSAALRLGHGVIEMSDDIIIEHLHDGRILAKELLANGFQPGEKQQKFNRKNSTKTPNNIRRAKSKFMYIVSQNRWELFVTFTIASNDFAGLDIKTIMQTVTQFIRNENKRLGATIRYVLVPEQGKTGRWHIHGLMAGLQVTEMRLFSLNESLPADILRKRKAGKKVYDWPRFSARFGFCAIEVLENAIKAGLYIKKNIGAASSYIMENYNGNIYYASQGLNREPDRVLRGKKSQSIQEPDFETEFCRGKYFDNLEDAMELVDTEDIDNITAGKP